MNRAKLIKTVLIFDLVVLGPLLLSVLYSSPWGGQDAAAALEIPYPAAVAHRGLSYHAPEETAPAYLAAREIGADYLELDLQRTKDGVLLALHDDTLERTTDVAKVFPGREKQTVDQFTWAELQQLDAGSWFNTAFPERARPAFVGVKILRLSDVLDIAEAGPARPGLYIETKAASRFPGIEAQLITALAARGWVGPNRKNWTPAPEGLPNTANTRARVILQSFEKESLATLKALAPDVPRIYLIDQEMKKAEGYDTLVARARELGHGLGPVGYLGWPWYQGPAHRAGLVIHPYTINAGWQMRLLGFFGADGFFSDRAELLLQHYQRGPDVELAALFQKLGY